MSFRGRYFKRPPQALRRARLDNLALVPASLLPFKGQWQEVANNLPAGDMLIILPASSAFKKTVEAAANLLKAKGHRVTMVPIEQLP